MFFAHKKGKNPAFANTLGSSVECGLVVYYSRDGTRKGIVDGTKTKHMDNMFVIRHTCNKFKHDGEVVNKTEIDGGLWMWYIQTHSRVGLPLSVVSINSSRCQGIGFCAR